MAAEKSGTESMTAKGRIVFCTLPGEATPDGVTRGVFGKGVEQLIREIQLNQGGKYDFLYLPQAEPTLRA